MNDLKHYKHQLRIVQKDLEDMLAFGNETIIQSLQEQEAELQEMIKKGGTHDCNK